MKLSVLAFTCLAAVGVGAVVALTPALDGHPVRLNAGGNDVSAGAAMVHRDGDATSSVVEQGHQIHVAQATTPSPEAEQTAIAVDESALRYFASRGDTARLNTEIARLRALYPQWVPPENPLAVPQNDDPQLERLWKLYSEARYADVRKAIAERQVTDAAWTPPADLIDRLELAERRAGLLAAADAAEHAEVIDIAAKAPSLLTCNDVDVLWRVAEAFVHMKRVPRARDAYSYILKNCTNQSERIATVQKAAALLGYREMQDLLALEQPLADGKLEFEPIRDDLARRFVAEAENKELTVDTLYLQRLERLVEKNGLASDALLLGWYQLHRKNTSAAQRWFRQARQIEDTAASSQGLALTLIEGGNPQEAEEVMHLWKDSSTEAKSTYLAAAANLLALVPQVELTSEVLGRIAAATLKDRDPVAAQQFGWYALAFHQPQTAEQWFATALRWKVDDEPSAYGLAVSRLQLEDLEGLAEIKAAWQNRSERIARVGVPGDSANATVSDEPAGIKDSPVSRKKVRTRPGQEAEAGPINQNTAARRTASKRGGCHSTTDPESLNPLASLDLGWCLMDMNRPLEAAAAFKVAMRTSVEQKRQEAAYGQSLAYLRAGLVGQAAVAAAKTPQTSKRAAELQSAILSDRAISAFDSGRYRETILYLDQLAQLRTERVDLLVMRGYAYKNLNRRADARRLFEAAAGTGHRDAIRALGDLNAEDERRQ